MPPNDKPDSNFSVGDVVIVELTREERRALMNMMQGARMTNAADFIRLVIFPGAKATSKAEPRATSALLESIRESNASLETCLAWYEKQMPPADREQRWKVLRASQAAVEQLANSHDDLLAACKTLVARLDYMNETIRQPENPTVTNDLNNRAIMDGKRAIRKASEASHAT